MYWNRDKTNLLQARLIFFRILASCPWARIYYPVPQTVFYLGQASFQMAEHLLHRVAFEEFNYSSHSARRKLCCRGRCSRCIPFDILLLKHAARYVSWLETELKLLFANNSTLQPTMRTFRAALFRISLFGFSFTVAQRAVPFHLAAFAPTSPPVFSEQLPPTNVSRTLQ